MLYVVFNTSSHWTWLNDVSQRRTCDSPAGHPPVDVNPAELGDSPNPSAAIPQLASIFSPFKFGFSRFVSSESCPKGFNLSSSGSYKEGKELVEIDLGQGYQVEDTLSLLRNTASLGQMTDKSIKMPFLLLVSSTANEIMYAHGVLVRFI